MANLLQKLGLQDAAPLGHNNPPSDMEILQERMSESSGPLMEKIEVTLEAARAMPRVIADDDQAGEFADRIKEITGLIKTLESTRVAEKEPYLALTRAVDGHFKVPSTKLETAKKWLNEPLTAYQQRKATEERIRRENEAAALRKKADDDAAAAAELEKSNPVAAGIGMAQAVVTEQQAQHVQQSVTVKASELTNSRGNSGALASLRTRVVGEVVSRQMLDLNALRPYFTEDSLQKALNAAISAGIREVAGARIFEKTDTVVR